MSGLYDIVFPDSKRDTRIALMSYLITGEGTATPHAMLGRIRDMWLEHWGDDVVIAVYTRNGGGNREHFHGDGDDGMCTGCVMETIKSHPRYLNDLDDSFDPTYATIWFRLPDELDDGTRDQLRGLAVDPVDMSAKWKEQIERVERGDLHPEELALGEQIARTLEVDR